MNVHSRRNALRTALAASAAVTLLAAGCGTSGTGGSDGSKGDGKGTITYWDLNGGARTAIWKKVIAEFEKKHPSIHVKYVPIPVNDVQKKYDTAIAGGGEGLPDVGGVSTEFLANLVGQKALEPLGPYFKKSPLKDQINPKLIKAVQGAANSTGIYEVPMTAKMATLWYRTDLFKAKGLKPPTDWAAFYKAADTLTDKDQNAFGFTIRGGAGSITHVLDAMYAQSGIGSFWTDRGRTKTTLNDPRNVAALAKYAGLYDKVTPSADLTNDYIKMVAQFDNGDIGMLHHNLGSYINHVEALKGKFDGLPIPSATAGGPRTLVSYSTAGLGIMRNSDEKDAAWKFVEFAASPEMNSLWNEDVGQLPANNRASNAPWLKDQKSAGRSEEVLNDPSTQIVELPFYLPDFATITTSELEPEWQNVLVGKVTPKQFLDNFAAKINEAQADWNERHGE